MFEATLLLSMIGLAITLVVLVQSTFYGHKEFTTVLIPAARKVQLKSCRVSLGSGWYVFDSIITLPDGTQLAGTIESNRSQHKLNTFQIDWLHTKFNQIPVPT